MQRNPRILSLVRVTLAAIILLPPGTFRSLDFVGRSRADASVRASAAVELIVPDTGQATVGARVPPWRPLARDWRKFTFMSKPQTDQRSIVEPAFSSVPPQSAAPLTSLFRRRLIGAESSLAAHRAPREVLIALCELLH